MSYIISGRMAIHIMKIEDFHINELSDCMTIYIVKVTDYLNRKLEVINVRYYIADLHFFHEALNQKMDCRGYEELYVAKMESKGSTK